MAVTSRIGLPLMEASQSQKHVTHNEALLRLNALVQPAVLSAALTAPPGSPAEGDAYIVAATATGAWAGQEKAITIRLDGGWAFYPPGLGWTAYNVAGSALLIYDGTAWVSFVSGVGFGGMSSLNVGDGLESSSGTARVKLDGATLARSASGMKVAALGITAAEIAATTITAAKIAASTITATQIANTTITGAKMVSGTVAALQLAANAVTASKLAITDTSNIYPDPDFLDSASLTGTFSLLANTAGGASAQDLRLTALATLTDALSEPFLVEPSTCHIASIRMRCSGATANAYFITYSDFAATVPLTSTLIGTVSSVGTLTRFAVPITTDATAVRARLYFERPGNVSSSTASYTSPSVRRAIDAELRAPGYDSGQMTFTNGAVALSLTNHLLGALPIGKAQVRLECTTAEYGYAVGASLLVADSDFDGYGVTLQLTATQVGLAVATNGIAITRWDTRAVAAVTPASWRLRVLVER